MLFVVEFNFSFGQIMLHLDMFHGTCMTAYRWID
jgi:hypothetical protein